LRHVGVSVPLPPPAPHVTTDMAPFAKEAERLGFESVWVAEHVVAPVNTDRSKNVSRYFVDGQVPGFQDPIVAMARASAVTSAIKLGTSVLLVPEHHPVRLAKMIGTLDCYSGGRVLLGIGTGWLREEAEIMGVDFDHRWTQTRECIEALKTLWTQDQAEYHGRYVSFPAVRSTPKPARKPHPPILIGGIAPNVLKRVVACADGWAPERIDPPRLKEQVAELRELARRAGRDPQSIEVSVHGKQPDPELIAAFFEAGADRVVTGVPIVNSEREALEHLRRIAPVVLPVARKFR